MAMAVAFPTTFPVLNDVVDIDASQNTCVVRRDGTVWCWGDGYLGGGAPVSAAYATHIDGLEGVVQVDAGETGWCARHDDGTVSCWGAFASPSAVPPVLRPPEADIRDYALRKLPQVEKASDIAVGAQHACVLDGGSVRCWGQVVGPNHRPDNAGPYRNHTYTLETVDLPKPAREIDAGSQQTCAVLADDTVWCWGSNLSPSLMLQLPGQPLHRLESGSGSTCGVARDGAALCFDATGAPAPRAKEKVLAQSVGFVHRGRGLGQRCIVTTEGAVRCFAPGGARSWNAASSVKVVDLPIKSAVDVAVGRKHRCALLKDSTVQCWGSSLAHRLGVGPPRAMTIPLKKEASDVLAFTLDSEEGAWCARTAGDRPTIECRGLNLNTPGELVSATSIAFAGSGLCGTLADGNVHCIDGGRNGANLTALDDFRVARDLRGNPSVVCGIDGKDTLHCRGRLDVLFRTAAPPLLQIPDVLTYFVEPQGYGCALRRDGEVLCFGANYRGGPARFRANYDDPYFVAQPVQLHAGQGRDTPVSAVADLTGQNHWACIRAESDIACGLGPLMAPTAYLYPIPNPMAFDDWAVTYNAACLVSEGALYCLSHLDRYISHSPVSPPLVQVQDVEDAKHVWLSNGDGFGKAHGCLLREDRSLWCWTQPWTMGEEEHAPVSVRRLL